jgi:cysteinyl-tRNA synthetase
MAELVLYNTRTRRKEALRPLVPGRVGVYTCGPTVYAPQHVGNLRSQLFADLLKRVLLAEGLRVTHVVNVTDVGHLTGDVDTGEDKVEQAALASGRRAEDVTREYTEQWLRDRARVGCLAPEVLCRATDHIAEQIELVSLLEARGCTYRIQDGVYFDVSKFPRYAEFARLALDEQAGGARIGDVPGKRHPADFALWKLSPPGVRRQQEWDSPWGRGFPGWHLECTAMSRRYLGDHFDIHTGGMDHVPVHHTNEIAQAECAFASHPWVQVWMHNAFLDFSGEKMAKSIGNVVLLDDLVARGFEPMAFRYFFLQAHYRQPQAFGMEAIEAADRAVRRLAAHYAAVRDAQDPIDPGVVQQHRGLFRDAILDDLNAPQALAVTWSAVRGGAGVAPATQRALLDEFDAVLGLGLSELAERLGRGESDPRIDALVTQREEARRRRDFAEADRIRAALAQEGVAIEDTPQGARWRRA